MKNRLLALFLMFLPSSVKVGLLRSLGHQVHSTAFIGFSYLNVGRIQLAEDTYIGHGNIFTSLDYLELGAGSRINRWNRFTSAAQYNGRLVLGERTSVSLQHFFDVCDLFRIGNDTIVAGHHSTFFTHSKGIDTVDYTCPIEVGDWCYLGSNLCVVPGASIGSYTFVGMGAVVTKDFSDQNYCLLAGNPARVKKHLSPDSRYFDQGQLVHPHMAVRTRRNAP